MGQFVQLQVVEILFQQFRKFLESKIPIFAEISTGPMMFPQLVCPIAPRNYFIIQPLSLQVTQVLELCSLSHHPLP